MAGRGSGPEPAAPVVHPELLGAAFTAIHMGYLSRVAETDIFESAREPSAWISAQLAERAFGRAPYGMLVDLAGELAFAEPVDPPGPGDDAPTVRIPGGRLRSAPHAGDRGRDRMSRERAGQRARQSRGPRRAQALLDARLLPSLLRAVSRPGVARAPRARRHLAPPAPEHASSRHVLSCRGTAPGPCAPRTPSTTRPHPRRCRPCYRGPGFTGFTAPARAPDAGTRYPTTNGQCRALPGFPSVCPRASSSPERLRVVSCSPLTPRVTAAVGNRALSRAMGTGRRRAASPVRESARQKLVAALVTAFQQSA